MGSRDSMVTDTPGFSFDDFSKLEALADGFNGAIVKKGLKINIATVACC